MQDIFFALKEPELAKEMPQIGGGKPGQKHMHRDQEEWHEYLFQDYFAKNPTFDAMKFRRSYKIRRELFLHFIDVVCCFDF